MGDAQASVSGRFVSDLSDSGSTNLRHRDYQNQDTQRHGEQGFATPTLTSTRTERIESERDERRERGERGER